MKLFHLSLSHPASNTHVVFKSAVGPSKEKQTRKERRSGKWNGVLGTKYIYIILNFYMFHFVLNTQNCVCHRQYLSGPILPPHTPCSSDLFWQGEVFSNHYFSTNLFFLLTRCFLLGPKDFSEEKWFQCPGLEEDEGWAQVPLMYWACDPLCISLNLWPEV